MHIGHFSTFEYTYITRVKLFLHRLSYYKPQLIYSVEYSYVHSEIL
jgi:hypothetical protein